MLAEAKVEERETADPGRFRTLPRDAAPFRGDI